MPDSETLTTTGILAAATEFLLAGGYAVVPEKTTRDHGLGAGRVFEDAYGVVAVMVCETWEELRTTWPDYQGGLVDLLAAFVSSAEAKAWEGYLVLLTLGGGVEDAEVEANSIRYNTTRVRKLVGIGTELQTLADLERVLRPVLPVKPRSLAAESSSSLELLPELLGSDQLPKQVIRSAVSAFLDSTPIVEAIDQSEGSS